MMASKAPQKGFPSRISPQKGFLLRIPKYGSLSEQGLPFQSPTRALRSRATKHELSRTSNLYTISFDVISFLPLAGGALGVQLALSLDPSADLIHQVVLGLSGLGVTGAACAFLEALGDKLGKLADIFLEDFEERKKLEERKKSKLEAKEEEMQEEGLLYLWAKVGDKLPTVKSLPRSEFSKTVEEINKERKPNFLQRQFQGMKAPSNDAIISEAVFLLTKLEKLGKPDGKTYEDCFVCYAMCSSFPKLAGVNKAEELEELPASGDIFYNAILVSVPS